MNRRNNLFLIELVVCLFLFAVSAAVCVGLVIHARGVSRESGELTQAVYLAQSAAETWKSGGQPPTGGDGGFTVTCTENSGSLDVSVWKDGRLLYSIEGVSRIE